jgi:low affinity Fe/Cu permease
MALGFVVLGMIIGAAAAVASFVSGAGVLYAVLVYAGIGASTILGVVLLQAIVGVASEALGAQPRHS